MSLFITIIKNYATSPWNLNNLATLSDSIFSHINVEISGMKVDVLSTSTSCKCASQY